MPGGVGFGGETRPATRSFTRCERREQITIFTNVVVQQIREFALIGVIEFPDSVFDVLEWLVVVAPAGIKKCVPDSAPGA